MTNWWTHSASLCADAGWASLSDCCSSPAAGSSSLSSEHHTPLRSVQCNSTTSQRLALKMSKTDVQDRHCDYLALSCSPATPEETAWTGAAGSSCSPSSSPHTSPTHCNEDTQRLLILFTWREKKVVDMSVFALPLHNLDFRSQFLDLSVLLLFGFGFVFKTGKRNKL